MEAANAVDDALASAGEAASSASSASTSASAASTSATNAASSASSASTSASTATTKASEAATSATNAASSASSASTSATNASNSASAAATSETNAASSASSASTSASTATTKASEASTSATNAASSASAASTSASSASSSASTASTSATNAASSATSAASSATSAASSAASAAASLDSFDDRYLGSKTSDPTLDNDGNALATGALYYNSTEGEMRVYDGSQWIAASAASQAILTKYKYVATAGQTTFTGSDANSLTLAYTVGSIIVTLNGVVLNGTDYTATTGTSVVLAVAASLNDELNVLSFSTFDVANTYTQAQADARYLNLAGGTLTGDVRLNNGSADGAQFQLASSGYSDWNLDNYSGRLRAYYGSTEYMTINASGNVGIGTSSPSYKLDVQSSAASGIVGRFVASGGGASGYMYSGGDFYLASDTSANTSIGLNSSSNYVRFWTNGNERARIDSSGNLLVGTTSVPNGSANGFAIQSGGYFQTSRASTGAGIIHAQFQNPNGVVGSITTGGSSTSYVTSSDYRLKENIVPMTGALGVVAQLNPVTYTWKTDGADGQGFIAHELQAVVPEAVVGEKDAVETYLDEEGNEQTRPVYQGIDTSFLVATLTAAIQELKAVVDAQAARIEALEQA